MLSFLSPQNAFSPFQAVQVVQDVRSMSPQTILASPVTSFELFSPQETLDLVSSITFLQSEDSLAISTREAIYATWDLTGHWMQAWSHGDGKKWRTGFSCTEFLPSAHVYFDFKLSQDVREILRNRLVPGLLESEFKGAGAIYHCKQGTTSPLHFDREDTVLIQVQGIKRVLVFPPELVTSVYMPPSGHPGQRHSLLIDLQAVNFTAFPRARDLIGRGFFVDLHPGQALMFPRRWLHHVESLSNQTMTLSLRFDAPNTPQFGYFDLLKQPLPSFLARDWTGHTALLFTSLEAFVLTLLQPFPRGIENYLQRWAAVSSGAGASGKVILRAVLDEALRDLIKHDAVEVLKRVEDTEVEDFALEQNVLDYVDETLRGLLRTSTGLFVSSFFLQEAEQCLAAF